MVRPKRDSAEEKVSAVQEYEQMRRVDEELLGLADDIDQILQHGFRPEVEVDVPDPPKAGEVRTYQVDPRDVRAAWGDSKKLRELVLKARGRDG